MLSALGDGPDESLSFDELVQRSGLDAELVRLATDTGLVRPVPGTADEAPASADGSSGDGTRFGRGALTMLRAATELLGAEMPLDGLVGLALRHASNMDAVAADAVDLFASRFAELPGAQRADLAARLIPLVTDLVAEHFRQSLVERATERMLADDAVASERNASDEPLEAEPNGEAVARAAREPASRKHWEQERETTRDAAGRRTISRSLSAAHGIALACRELPGTVDPLAVFASAGTMQRTYWASPDDDLEFCALGSAFEVAAEAGTDRFGSAAETLKRLNVTVTGDSGHPIGPLLVGGFSFSADGAVGESAWAAFGAGRLTLPELLVVRRSGRCWMTAVPDAPVWPIMAASRSAPEAACATCGVADGAGGCGLASAQSDPGEAAPGCSRAPADQPGGAADEFGSAALDEAPADAVTSTSDGTAVCIGGDPELADMATGDLNAAALAALGSSYRTDDGYVALVQRALGRIAEGGLDKVVTARELRIASALEPIAVLGRLRKRYPSCVTFAFGHGSQTFFGATPERLVHFDGTRVRTDALAGSRPRHSNPARNRELAAELQRDPKELTEHAMVVTDVRDTLRAHGVALDPPSPMGVMELRRIMHLHTPIAGRVAANTTVLELAGALHPTAAVAGLPRRVAREWIAEHEGFDRGWYAAPIGWTTLDGHGEFRVALRCALTGPSETRLFAGGGIVTDADPSAELAETSTKLEALLFALEGAETGGNAGASLSQGPDPSAARAPGLEATDGTTTGSPSLPGAKDE